MVGLGHLLPVEAISAKCLYRFRERLNKHMWRRDSLWITKYRKHIRLRKLSKLKIVVEQEIIQGMKFSSPVPTFSGIHL